MIEKTICPHCGGSEVYFIGVDDGGGDYGDCICDQYECQECGQDFEAHCIGDDDDGFDADAYGNKDISDDLGEPSTSIDDIPY